MLFTHYGRRRRGFTLIELLTVILILSLLALIVVARLLHNGRMAREATLRSNLANLRTAIASFEADCGIYPARLADLAAQTAPVTGAAGMRIEAEAYAGPYLIPSGGIGGQGIPMNPFAGATATVEESWAYTALDGTVTCAPPGTTMDGVPFSHL